MPPHGATDPSSPLIQQASAAAKRVKVQAVEMVLIAVASGAALITLVSLLMR